MAGEQTDDPERAETAPLLDRPALKPPVALRLRSSKSFIVFTVAAAIFTDSFLYGVAVPIFPFILPRRAGVPPEDVQKWQSGMLSLFGAVGLLASPIFGIYADRTKSRRIPFLIGLGLNSVATIILSVARTAPLFALSRALQGLASTVVWSVGLAVICDSVPRKEIGHWLGWAVSSTNLGLITAPTLGGIVYAQAGYNAFVGMCAALLSVDILLRLVMIEKKKIKHYDISPPQRKAVYGTVSPNEQAATAAGPPADRTRVKIRLPLMIRYLLNPRFASAFYGFTIFIALCAGFDGVLVIYVKTRYGWDPVHAGIIYMTLAVPNIGGSVVGAISDKIGPKIPAAAGLVLASALLVLLGFVDHPGMDQPWILVLVLSGIGFSLVFIATPFAADMSNVVEIEQERSPTGKSGYAQAYALLNCCNAIGEVIGPLVTGSLVERFGWRTMNITLACIMASAIPSTLLFTGGPRDEDAGLDEADSAERNALTEQ